MEISKNEVSSLLEKTEIRNKIFNSFNEFLRFQDDLKTKGLQFEKTVTKFSKTSAAIYLPKRLIGKTFRVFLMPINDPYEVMETDKQTDKLLKDTEKELNAIQEDTRKNLLAKPIESIYG